MGIEQSYHEIEQLEKLSDEELFKMTPLEVFKYMGIEDSNTQRYPLILNLFENGIVLFDGSLNPHVDGVDTSSGYNYIGTVEQNILLKANLIRNRDLFDNGVLVSNRKEKRITVGIDWIPGSLSSESFKEDLSELKDSVLDGISQANLEKMTPLEVFKYMGIEDSNTQRYPLILNLFENGIVLFDGSLNPYVDGVDTSSGYNYIGTVEQNEKLKRNILHNRSLLKDGKLIPGRKDSRETVK